ncbi:MAG TPA: DegT/DnrJ/EryC1/StrS family aminotransferase [Acidobacteriota bacterium]
MKPVTQVPFLDLVTPHLELEEELVSIFRIALRTGVFVGGSMVEEFETDFAEFCDSRYCVGVGSGTEALRLALMGGGVKQGDMVVTVPNTFIATTEAISQTGALPDFVDIDERTYNMDPEKLRDYLESQCYIDRESAELVNQRTKRPVRAVIPVHLFGQMADMDPILEVAERYNLIVIEDACQAHGAEYFSKKQSRWRKAGSMGRAAAFSFYPGKNLGACGEAGAVTTDDEQVARKIRLLRDHGQSRKYCHEIEGYNARLDAIQAGILRVKLKSLLAWNQKRRQMAFRYNELLQLVDGIIVPFEPAWARSSHHLYVIRTLRRDELRKYLAEEHIGSGLHYPRPLHLQKAYESLGFKEGDFPVSERVASEILSLPMYPQLEVQQLNLVFQKISEFAQSQTVLAV